MSIFLILFVTFYFSASIVCGFVTEHSLLKVAQKKIVGAGEGRRERGGGRGEAGA
jgi:hypothetical protein